MMDAPTEREKWAQDVEFKKEELRLKERELAMKENELALRKADQAAASWRSPLVLAIVAAAIAAAGNATVSLINGTQQRKLEDQKSEQARILEMLKTGNPDAAADNLKFLVDLGLISNREMVDRLTEFQRTRRPGTGPALPSPTAPVGNSIAERISALEDATSPASIAPDRRFQVRNNVLFDRSGKPVSIVEAPKKGQTSVVVPRAIVMHFSADRAENAAVRAVASGKVEGSTHIVIGRSGDVTQLVAFDVAAFHAGNSKWRDLSGLNKHTIGVTFENAGRLNFLDGSWRMWSDQPIDSARVLTRRNPETGQDEGWEKYTDAQIASAIEVIRALAEAYPQLEAVLRHSDVTVPAGRKVDPGPALDVDRLQAILDEARKQR